MKTEKWNSSNISDQTGRVAIVTGSSSGIGFETARVLTKKNATVIIAVRSLEKGRKAGSKITDEYQNADIEIMELDLASLASVQRFVDAFKRKYARLDLLINNAGVMVPPYSKTTDGFELQFGTNHLGHFALTVLLIDLLKNTSGSRVVSVSSMAHKIGNIDFDDLNWEKRKYKKWQAYGDSKIANLYFTYALQRRFENGDSGPIAAAAHPGWTATDLQRHTGLASALNHIFAQNSEMGALPTLYAATAEDIKGADFVGPGGFQEMKGYPKKVKANALSQDQDIADRLWQLSEEMTGVNFPK